MERSIRPHGLTTLAVLNFIFAGFKTLGFLVSLAALGCVSAAGTSGQAVEQEMIGYMLVFSIIDLALAGLLIVSGIGYLKINRITGRVFGSVWALAEIVKAFVIIWFGASMGMEFNLGTMVSFIYPLLTLFFVNIVFRDLWRRRSADSVRQESSDSQAAPAESPTGHIRLLTAQYIRQTLRGIQGILFLLLTLTFFLVMASVSLLPIEATTKQLIEMGGQPEDSRQYLKPGVERVAAVFFNWLLDEGTGEGYAIGTQEFHTEEASSDWNRYLVQEQPALLSFIFSIMTALLPVLTSFLVFNQISQDAKRKGYRYLLLRTTRSSIYFGKFISSLFVLLPIIILSVTTIAVYIHFKLQLYPFQDILSWSLRAMLALSILSLPSIAFCLFFSALFNSSFGSLAISSLWLGFYPIIARLIKDSAHFMGFLQYLHPLKIAYFLYHPEWWVVVLAAVGCILYAAVFTGGGYIYFKRKSL